VVVMYAGRVVESADIRTIFKRPGHPYTRGLLQSIPRLDDERRRLYQIAGSVPVASALPSGCPFHPRCSVALDVCSRTDVELWPAGTMREAACVHASGSPVAT